MKQQIEQVLDFSLSLAQEMLKSGASLERVNDSVRRICYSYELADFSLYSLSTVMMLSARDTTGETVQRMRNMKGTGIHLEKLDRLNQLSRRVCAEKPHPYRLMSLLDEALQVKEYPQPVVLLGSLTALTCLCFMFGGTVKDAAFSLAMTALLFVMGLYVKKPWINNVVYNAFATFLVGTLELLAVHFGLADQIYTLMITSSMVLVPGIPLVNATSNLFCGNEMNGILELFKVVLETLAIVSGFVVAIYLFGGLIVW